MTPAHLRQGRSVQKNRDFLTYPSRQPGAGHECQAHLENTLGSRRSTPARRLTSIKTVSSTSAVRTSPAERWVYRPSSNSSERPPVPQQRKAFRDSDSASLYSTYRSVVCAEVQPFSSCGKQGKEQRSSSTYSRPSTVMSFVAGPLSKMVL